MTEQSLTF